MVQHGSPHVLADRLDGLVRVAHVELAVHVEPAADAIAGQLRVAHAQREALDLHVLEEGRVLELGLLALAQAHDAVIRRTRKA